jgi:hypothetical protein
MRKIHWFDANRAFSVNVAEYMAAVVWKKEINLRLGAEINSVQESLVNVDKMAGSVLQDRIPELKKTFLARLGELEVQRKEEIQRQGTYTPAAADSLLKRTLTRYAQGKPGAIDPVEALQVWFASYGLTVEEDSPIIREILEGAGEKLDFRTLVSTDGRVATNFNATNCYKMAFCKVYEHMVNAGTIKPVQIPAIVRDKYAKKTKKQ